MGFALEYLPKDDNFWKNVIYTDEKTFSTSDQNDFYCYRLKGERYLENNVSASRRSGRIDVGMWGWIWGYGVGEIYPLYSRFNSTVYLDILENILLPSVRSLNPHEQIYLLHDNSPVHKSKLVQNWLKSRNDITVINWPSLSPDLNPIENIWARIVLKWQIGNCIKTKDALVKHVKNIWEEMRGCPDICENLALSMKRRLISVIDNNGGHTKY